MKRFLLATAALAVVGLGGCASVTKAQNINSFITTLSQTNCHVTGTFAATVGAMNPGSGANLTTSIDCPNGGASNSTTTTNVKPGPEPLPPPVPPPG